MSDGAGAAVQKQQRVKCGNRIATMDSVASNKKREQKGCRSSWLTVRNDDASIYEPGAMSDAISPAGSRRRAGRMSARTTKSVSPRDRGDTSAATTA